MLQKPLKNNNQNNQVIVGFRASFKLEILDTNVSPFTTLGVVQINEGGQVIINWFIQFYKMIQTSLKVFGSLISNECHLRIPLNAYISALLKLNSLIDSVLIARLGVPVLTKQLENPLFMAICT